jgi:hypothetical protein
MMQLWKRKSKNSFWVMRDANLAAYELAKSATSPASLLIVIQTLPSMVQIDQIGEKDEQFR